MLSKSEIKDLRSLHQKKYRDIREQYLVEGDKLVREAIQRKADIEQVFAVKEWSGVALAETVNIHLREVDDRALTQLCELRNPNQAAALINKSKRNLSLKELNVPDGPALFLYLDRLRDPGNMGTILRIADWYGLSAILCSPDSVDHYNQKVIQSSMGAIHSVDVIAVSDEELISFSIQHKLSLIATALKGSSTHDTLAEQRSVLMMGNEAQGLSAELMAQSNLQVTIPGKGAAESLNVAVATGILVDWALRS